MVQPLIAALIEEILVTLTVGCLCNLGFIARYPTWYR